MIVQQEASRVNTIRSLTVSERLVAVLVYLRPMTLDMLTVETGLSLRSLRRIRRRLVALGIVAIRGRYLSPSTGGWTEVVMGGQRSSVTPPSDSPHISREREKESLSPPRVPPKAATSDQQDWPSAVWDSYPAHRRDMQRGMFDRLWRLSVPQGQGKNVYEALAAYLLSADWQREEQRFVPNLSKWLGSKRWQNPPSRQQTRSKWVG